MYHASITRDLVIRLTLAAIWFVVFAVSAYAQQKYALLVGVGDHIYPSNSLLGPKNDIPAFHSLLIEKYGFKPENIAVLQDKEATRDSIVAAFERRLIVPAREGDLALFYFTGHGTQVTDYSGDEADKRDEAFVPYDGKTISTLLIDDDLSKLINRIKTQNIVVILDACHSGTGTRGVARAKRVTAKELGIEEKSDLSDSANNHSDTNGMELSNALVISATTAGQIAVDYPFLLEETTASKNVNANMGALTYYLLQSAWNQDNYDLTYQTLTDLICAELGNNGFGQTPQLEGAGQNAFLMFAEQSIENASPASESPDTLTSLNPKVHAEVVAVREGDVTIRSIGGISLVRGSIFETIDQTINNEPNAIRLVESSGQTAIGEMLSGRVEASDRLVETFHFVPKQKLRLAVVGDSLLVGPVSQELAAFRFIEIVSGQDFRDADFEVRQTGPSVYITPYRNQQQLPDIEISDIDSTAARTKQLLENLYAVNLLSTLRNPNSSFHVDIQVNGQDYGEISIGSDIEFTVTVDQDAYVYVVDVDPAGNVTVLFPNSYEKQNFLEAGMTYKLPTAGLYRLQVSGPSGPELIKVFASTLPLKLDILAADSSASNNANDNAVDVAQSIIDQLKREVNRLSARGITVLPAAADEQPFATEVWASDDVLLRVVK